MIIFIFTMITATIIGLLLGIFSGIMPGIGSASILLIIFPYLITLPANEIFILYLAIVVSSQYVASVTAIYIGIPGSESAAPTAKEFGNIKKLGLTNSAISQNALASLFGNIVGLLLFLSITPFIFYLSSLYQNNIKLAILSTAYISLVLCSDKKLQTIISIVIGSLLMSLGYNEHTFENVNLGFELLDNGLSWVAITTGALIGSALYSLTDVKIKNADNVSEDKVAYNKEFSGSVVRGSIVGFIVGFVPGLSYVLSAILAYSYEQRILKSQRKEVRVLNSIASSEAAQSAGSISMLIPLLVFSIPITAGEGVVLNLITLTDTVGSTLDKLLANIPLFIGLVLFINISSFIIALNCKRLVQLIFSIPIKIIKILLVSFGALAVVFSTDYYFTLHLITYLSTIIIFSRFNINPLPLVMSVLLFNTMQSSVYLFKDLL